MNNIKCHFCERFMIVPSNQIEIFIGRIIRTYKKRKCKTAMEKLNTLRFISPMIEEYIKKNHNEIYDELRFSNRIQYMINSETKKFLKLQKETKIYTGDQCTFCNRKACGFHSLYGGFKYFKCKKCNKSTSLCGWCDEKNKVKNTCAKCSLLLKGLINKRKIINITLGTKKIFF